MDRKKTVLVVDDDREIARGLAIRLRARGYDVVCAADGESGLSVATSRQPDLIILDMRMPGMDGLALLQQLRAIAATAATPCIVLSANATESAQRQALSHGARRFLAKPFDATSLLTAVEELLDATPAGDRPGRSGTPAVQAPA